MILQKCKSTSTFYTTDNTSSTTPPSDTTPKASFIPKNKFSNIDPPQLLTISSFFKYPEGDINEYQNLSKGTAFLVKLPSGLLIKNDNLYCITCAHITHPFHFPNLYKEEQHEWIYNLGESNIKVQLEYRDQKTGQLLHTIPLKPPYHLHPTLDLVAFKVDPNEFTRSNLPYTTTIIELEDYEHPIEGHEGKLFGYRLVDEKENILKPIESEYKFHCEESSHRFYVQTKTPSPMGVCGGPVINIENEVVGMVEGLVQIDSNSINSVKDREQREFIKACNNNTVFIPSQVLNRFLKSIDLEFY
eukprot:gene7980-9816_t